jgi:hypothetical protein
MERDSGRIFDPKLFELFYSLMRGRGGAAGTAQAA